MHRGPVVLALAVAASLVCAGLAPPALAAAASDLSAAPPEEDADEDAPPAAAVAFPVLLPASQFAAGLEGMAGIAAQFTQGEDRAHGLVGGLLRVRYGYVQAGATHETTDSGEASDLYEPTLERWRAVGGFAGIWLPYQRWVDLEGAVGFVARRYSNPARIYGPSGFDVSSTALTFRFGVSDRLGERLLGIRLGAALLVSADLQSHAPAWRRESLRPDGKIDATTGTTDIGGVSIGLVIAAGFEVGGGAAR